MKAVRYFRAMIVLIWCLPYISIALDVLTHGISGPPTNFSPPADISWMAVSVWVAGIVAFFVLVVASVGLWFFQRWERLAYMLATIPYVLVRPFSTAFSYTYWGELLGYLDYALEGALIATAFLPPVALLFAARTPNQSLEPTAGRRDAQI
jgi:L-lactate permease